MIKTFTKLVLRYLSVLVLLSTYIGVNAQTINLTSSSSHVTNLNGWAGTLPSGYSYSGSGTAFSSPYKGTSLTDNAGGVYSVASYGFGFQSANSATEVIVIGSYINATGSIIEDLLVSFESYKLVERGRDVQWILKVNGTDYDDLQWNSAEDDGVSSFLIEEANIPISGAITISIIGNRLTGSGSSDKIAFNYVTLTPTLAVSIPSSIVLGTISPDEVCGGTTVTIPYTATGFAPGTTFKAQAAVAGGSTFVDISATTTSTTSVTATIPTFGDDEIYDVRIISSDAIPVMSGTGDIYVFGQSSLDAISNASVCLGATATIAITGSNIDSVQVAGLSSVGINNYTSAGTASLSLIPTTVSATPVTVTLTPFNAGCAGTAITFQLTVNALPELTAVTYESACAAAIIPAMALTSSSPVDSLVILGGTSGLVDQTVLTATIPSFTATSTAGTHTILVAPYANGCEGEILELDLTVVALGLIDGDNYDAACPSSTIPASTLTITGTVDSIVINGGGSGLNNLTISDNIIPEFIANMTSGTYTITATPFTNGCEGESIELALVLNEVPMFTGVEFGAVCPEGLVESVTLTSAMPIDSFVILGNGSGLDDMTITGMTIPAFTASAISGSYLINVTAWANGCSGSGVDLPLIVQSYNVPSDDASNTGLVNAEEVTFDEDGTCNLIATVASLENLGVVNTQVTVGAPGYHNGNPFIGRYFDIHSASNPTATSEITIYISQDDIDAFNALPEVVSAEYDAINSTLSNIKLTVFHGLPIDGTTGPNGSYDSTNKELITPTVTDMGDGIFALNFTMNGFSGIFAHTSAAGIPLSIEMSDITLSASNNQHTIAWKTLSEGAPYVFEVEKGNNGQSFEKIGAVNAKGQASAYRFVDAFPNTNNNFYRVKMINLNDGKFKYSNVVNALGSNQKVNLAAVPNPAKNTIAINVNGHVGADAQLMILDQMGRVVTTKSITGAGAYQFDLSAYASGVYQVIFIDDWAKENVKFVVEK